MTRGGIWWDKDRDAAIDYLHFIERRYNENRIKVIRTKISLYDTYTEFENGDIWRVIKAVNSARGYAYNQSAIELNMPEELIHCIIKPCTKLPPYKVYTYF
jgi:hypothetical protein